MIANSTARPRRSPASVSAEAQEVTVHEKLKPPQPNPSPPSPVTRDNCTSVASGCESSGNGTIEVIDSTTEQVVGTVPEGTPDDVDRAVAAARGGYEAWCAVPVEQRSALEGIGTSSPPGR